MAAVTGLTLIKRFTYRDDPNEEFSNTYHFNGPPPGDTASWDQLAQDAWFAESGIFDTGTHLVRVYGYDSDDPTASHVYTHDYTVPGPPPAGIQAPYDKQFAGDQAACVWWKTARLNSRGKAIYLRKYFHAGGASATDRDGLDPSYESRLGLFAGNASGGMNEVHGGLRSRSHPESIIAAGHVPWVTTRTLKRRGKRPRTGG